MNGRYFIFILAVIYPAKYLKKNYGNKYRIALKNIFSRPDLGSKTTLRDNNCIKLDLTPAWRDVALC